MRSDKVFDKGLDKDDWDRLRKRVEWAWGLNPMALRLAFGAYSISGWAVRDGKCAFKDGHIKGVRPNQR